MPAPNTYDASTSIRIRSNFTIALTGAHADPTAVILSVCNPKGVVTVYNTIDLIRESAGVFYKDIILNVVGVWTYKWQGTGAVEAASPDIKIIVERTRFPIVS